MKIETISIVIAEKPKLHREQAHLMQWDMTQPRPMAIYTLGDHRSPVEYVPTAHQRTIDITCMCPRCATEFRMTIRYLADDNNVEMVCVCGLPLHILPERRRERFTFDDIPLNLLDH